MAPCLLLLMASRGLAWTFLSPWHPLATDLKKLSGTPRSLICRIKLTLAIVVNTQCYYQIIELYYAFYHKPMINLLIVLSLLII